MVLEHLLEPEASFEALQKGPSVLDAHLEAWNIKFGLSVVLFAILLNVLPDFLKDFGTIFFMIFIEDFV